MILGKKSPNYLENKACPSAFLFTTEVMRTDPESNTGLSHGTAMSLNNEIYRSYN